MGSSVCGSAQVLKCTVNIPCAQGRVLCCLGNGERTGLGGAARLGRPARKRCPRENRECREFARSDRGTPGPHSHVITAMTEFRGRMTRRMGSRTKGMWREPGASFRESFLRGGAQSRRPSTAAGCHAQPRIFPARLVEPRGS